MQTLQELCSDKLKEMNVPHPTTHKVTVIRRWRMMRDIFSAFNQREFSFHLHEKKNIFLFKAGRGFRKMERYRCIMNMIIKKLSRKYNIMFTDSLWGTWGTASLKINNGEERAEFEIHIEGIWFRLKTQKMDIFSFIKYCNERIDDPYDEKENIIKEDGESKLSELSTSNS